MSDETNDEWDDTAEEIDDLVTEGGGSRWPYVVFLCVILLVGAALAVRNRVTLGNWLSPRPEHEHTWVPAAGGAVLLRPIGPGQWEPIPAEMCRSCQMLRLP